MTTLPAPNGDLALGHLLDAAGVDPGQTLLLRHTYTVGGLESTADLAPSVLLAYTRRQEHRNKVGRRPPPLWLNFVADGQLRARFLSAYENHGEVDSEATDEFRYFDLRPSPVMSRLQNRLVIEWSKDTVNWAKVAERAASLPVVEIADPAVEQFPGFDRVLISHSQLEAVVHDSRYAPWRVALAAVQGVYLIADLSTGKLYVGKADGGDRILGRWSSYAKDGHGGNVALRELGADPAHRQHFQYSVLRVFGPSIPSAEIDESEGHFKRALLTREYGLNRN